MSESDTNSNTNSNDPIIVELFDLDFAEISVLISALDSAASVLSVQILTGKAVDPIKARQRIEMYNDLNGKLRRSNILRAFKKIIK